ncbi:hypothetical protein A9Q83_07450 [Alphaproteobacteria bacterium 46_93_T64]|nr:hypothetical protein A9Q83_07450 [Alphaproteobacteria bacterium 46_93_T64]
MITSTHNVGMLYPTRSPTVYNTGDQAVRSAQTQPSATEGDAVLVTLSPAAEGAKKLLSEFPRLSLDPAVHMQKAEVALKDLMARLGIPENTDVQIEVQPDGKINVEGDHPLISQIEESLNGEEADQELRSALIFAHNGSIISHIGKAVEMAMRGADERSGMMESYHNWVRNVANEAKGSSFAVNFSNGELTGSLVGRNGQAFNPGEGLTLPA